MAARNPPQDGGKIDHDPRKAAAYYQKMQRRYSARLYRRDDEATVK